MTGVLDITKDYMQSHSISVTAGLIVTLPGAYFLLTGKSICALGICSNVPSQPQSAIARGTEVLSVHQPQYPLAMRFFIPKSEWNDKPASAFILHMIKNAQKNIASFLITTSECIGLDSPTLYGVLEDRWAVKYPISRFALVATTTALPGAFLVFVRNHPESWAAKHQNQVANALHVIALVTVANQRISIQDLLVTALVMVSFVAFQRSVGSAYAERDKTPPAIETLLSQTHSIIAKSNIVVPLLDMMDDTQSMTDRISGDGVVGGSSVDEVSKLQRLLTEAKTLEKVKEIELKRVQNDLSNARDTLNETFAEYSNLRDEMKTVKHTIGRDQQAIIYRKDIELFALRKGNEQKENQIKDKESKLEDVHQKYKAALELKDAQLHNLKERIAFLEQHGTREMSDEVKIEREGDGDHQAIQVKLLRVRGRNSLETERSSEDKDAEIARLKEDLASAAQSCEALAHKQDELRRAWDATYEVQNSLNEEQRIHAKTREQLQEVAIRLEEEMRKGSQKNSPSRLPTIEEQDKRELETMFNTAQQDNLRLYSELDALDRRLREANARIFESDQEVETLREQLRLEKAINEDMETARPSLVHRVHFQRMEGQLKEARDDLESKNDEITRLKMDAATKDAKVKELEQAKDEALLSVSQLQEEGNNFRKTIKDLESTKEQLMLDHERLAQHRSRQRTTSAEHTSARSSGATLITDPIIQVITKSDEPLPPRPVTLVEDSSVQATPQSKSKAETSRVSMISNNIPPPELRGNRKKRLSLKGFMRKITDRDSGAESTKASKVKETPKEQPRPKTALAPKDKNALIRPQTAAVPITKAEKPMRPQTAAPATTAAPAKENKAPTRYYMAQEHLSKAGEENEKEDSGVDASSPRPKSQGWSAS